MPVFRATVWILSGAAAAIDGDAGTRRYIIEESADDAQDFEAQIRDRHIANVDTEVSFGPISEVKR